MSYFYYGSGPHYRYRGYNGLPNYYGYAYYVPQYANSLNYTVPFHTYPNWFYVPHAYYPRNRYTQENNISCKAASSKDNTIRYPQAYCPTNAYGTQQGHQTVCVFPDGSSQSAAENMAQCQDIGNWGVNKINELKF